MKVIENLISRLNDAACVAGDNLNNSTSKQQAIESKEELVKQLNNSKYIKVPFVGDFSAGKSSLLNSFMGLNLLPTNISPETAVSYELYFSETEKLEVWEHDKLKEIAVLEDISKLKVKPGDIVHVYLNNEVIQRLNERGIVIVDMPGIDSGIEAHNDAILNYIQEGTFFVVVVDVEQASLRGSTISFINEIKKYNLPLSILISKIDKKPQSEIEKIKLFIQDQAVRFVGSDVFVGLSSASAQDLADLNVIVNKLDAEKLLYTKLSVYVDAYIQGLMLELETQIKLTASDKNSFSEKITKLEKEKENSLKRLNEKSQEAQPLDESTEDILNDIHEALLAKSGYLAQLLFSSSNDTTQFNAEILSIIRPVLVDSIKREVSEYQEVISDCVKEFALNVDEILQDKDNPVLDAAQDVIGNLLGKDILEAVLKKGLDKLILKLAGYKGIGTFLKMLSKVLGPLTMILINILPDILRLIFGKSKDEKIADIQSKLKIKVFGTITEKLRPEIEAVLEQQRKESYNAMAEIISGEVRKCDDAIQAILNEKALSEQEIESRIARYRAAMDKLATILKLDYTVIV